MTTEHFEDDGVPAQNEAKVPRWLFWSYIFWAVLGIFWLIYFWNGSAGWLDRGHWFELEKAANTTFEYEKNKGYPDWKSP